MRGWGAELVAFGQDFDEARVDAVYAPVGMGSGISGLITTRDLLSLRTEIIGVVAAQARALALNCAGGQVVQASSAATFADGMACRTPHPDAVDTIRTGAARVVQVGEDKIAQAMRAIYADTHNVAEGAGAACRLSGSGGPARPW